VREAASGSLYLAYLRDPDGNKLGALYHVLPSLWPVKRELSELRLRARFSRVPN
jgi:hypothetical protein